MPLTDPLRVVVIDDHEVVREGVRLSFADHAWVEVVGTSSAVEATTLCERLRPDVAIVDTTTLCQRVRAVSPRSMVVLQTPHVSADRIREAIAAGVFAYVPKEAGLTALTDALEQAREGVDGTPAERFLLEVLRKDSANRERLQLSARQQRVLELAVEGRTDREIGELLCVSESTVRYHVQRIKVRLGARSKLELVHRAHAEGLVG